MLIGANMKYYIRVVTYAVQIGFFFAAVGFFSILVPEMARIWASRNWNELMDKSLIGLFVIVVCAIGIFGAGLTRRLLSKGLH